MTTCKLCGAAGPLVKCSHVIPRWMYGLMPNDGRNFRVISAFDGEYEQRSQSGLYGSFVCQGCENRFQIWDDYAAKILRKEPQLTAAGIDFGPYDYSKLARFYLSVLWRMHVCSHPFAVVDLGATAAPLGNALLGSDDDVLHEYEIVPTWSRHFLSFGILGPRWVEYDSVRYWKVYMPRFQVLINASCLLESSRHVPWTLKPGSPLLMLEETFESGEAEIAMKAISVNRERKDARHH